MKKPRESEHDAVPVVEAAVEAAPTGLTPVDDAAPEATAPADEAARLKAEIEDLKDQLLRKRADFENYRRRIERDRQQASSDASAELIRELVPTIDNLERALQAGGSEASVREGVALIHRELLALLEARGMAIDDPTGNPFDPERHQALSLEAVPGISPGSVVETLRKGYLFRDRLLRPALVKVAKEGEVAPADGDAGAIH